MKNNFKRANETYVRRKFHSTTLKKINIGNHILKIIVIFVEDYPSFNVVVRTHVEYTIPGTKYESVGGYITHGSFITFDKAYEFALKDLSKNISIMD